VVKDREGLKHLRIVALALSLLALSLTACVHSQIVPFHAEAGGKFGPPISPEHVAIYRTHGPYTSFKELGAISFSTFSPSTNSIYRQLREDAGEAGASAIIDLKMSGETHTEIDWEQRCFDRTECSSTGVCETRQDCHMEPVSKIVSTFRAVGTMIEGNQK